MIAMVNAKELPEGKIQRQLRDEQGRLGPELGGDLAAMVRDLGDGVLGVAKTLEGLGTGLLENVERTTIPRARQVAEAAGQARAAGEEPERSGRGGIE